jgi:WD40 repeat protein
MASRALVDIQLIHRTSSLPPPSASISNRERQAQHSQVVISGSRDNTLRVWDLETFGCRATLTGHTDDVVSVVVEPRAGGSFPSTTSMNGSGGEGVTLEVEASDSDPRGRRFFSASVDGTVRMWCSTQWCCVRVFLTAPDEPTSLALGVNLVAAGSVAGSVTVWNMEPMPSTTSSCERAASSRCAGDSSLHCYMATSTSCQSLDTDLWLEFEARLREFVAFRTISKDPSYRSECYRASKWLGHLLQSIPGAEMKFATHGDINPIVIGRVGHRPDWPMVRIVLLCLA